MQRPSNLCRRIATTAAESAACAGVPPAIAYTTPSQYSSLNGLSASIRR
ncbi:MAG: hypothetical protein IPM79_02505 [Polyangiaceae bacterium]|nr:hypothetical protein [Polyangiaceae bacterium]